MSTVKQQRTGPACIYIIGKITGLEEATFKAKFEATEKKIKLLGYKAINPCKLGIPAHFTYAESKPHNIKALRVADSVFIQRDWRDSEGSQDEIRMSIEAGKNLYYEESDGYEELKKESSRNQLS